MKPYHIALICVLLPLFTVHLTWLISSTMGNLNMCNPYWSHCHSISATGRQVPEFFVFKALMIPTAVCMAAYWFLLKIWIDKVSNGALTIRLITSLGYIASAALIVYTVTLGAEDEPQALARRIGVILYFAFSAFGHLLLLQKLKRINIASLGLSNERKFIYRICAMLVISGIASAIAGFLWEGWDNWENAYEWWFSLLMISLFYWVGRMWQKTGFTAIFSLASIRKVT
uniref:hypothetical protein n=1 Tax=Ningiella ruwaisensis TaxID=2364274 RepID=UPI0010A04241|nr:hypothetical protein [Ningiella ruwaisensis]